MTICGFYAFSYSFFQRVSHEVKKSAKYWATLTAVLTLTGLDISDESNFLYGTMHKNAYRRRYSHSFTHSYRAVRAIMVVPIYWIFTGLWLILAYQRYGYARTNVSCRHQKRHWNPHRIASPESAPDCVTGKLHRNRQRNATKSSKQASLFCSRTLWLGLTTFLNSWQTPVTPVNAGTELNRGLSSPLSSKIYPWPFSS